MYISLIYIIYIYIIYMIIYVYIYIYIHVNIILFIYLYMYVYIYLYYHLYIHIFTYMQISYFYKYTYIYICTASVSFDAHTTFNNSWCLVEIFQSGLQDQAQPRLQFATGNANDCVWQGHIFSTAVSLCLLKMVTKPLQSNTE